MNKEIHKDLINALEINSLDFVKSILSKHSNKILNYKYAFDHAIKKEYPLQCSLRRFSFSWLNLEIIQYLILNSPKLELVFNDKVMQTNVNPIYNKYKELGLNRFMIWISLLDTSRENQLIFHREIEEKRKQNLYNLYK